MLRIVAGFITNAFAIFSCSAFSSFPTKAYWPFTMAAGYILPHAGCGNRCIDVPYIGGCYTGLSIGGGSSSPRAWEAQK